MQKRVLPFILLALGALQVSAQMPRLFWDIPSIYAAVPDVSKVKNQIGLGAETTFNVASHWGTVRAGGGSTFTLDPKADDLGGSFLATPYLLAEAGAGMYRSNGNRCAKTKQNAFTAMALVGIRYDIDTRSVKPAEEENNYGLNFGVGAELGYFFIRDVFRNTELVARGTYFPNSKITSINFGFKFFLNVREFGDRY